MWPRTSTSGRCFGSASLDPLLARIRPAFEIFGNRSGSAGAGTRAELVQGVEDIRDVLGRHLAHEEEDAIPLMGTHLTPAELDAFVELSAAPIQGKGRGGSCSCSSKAHRHPPA